MKKILVLGASGLVGRALIDELVEGLDVYGTYTSNVTSLPHDKQFSLEVQHIDKMRELMDTVKPDVVISCLRGDYDHQLTFHEELAKSIKNQHTKVYYFSTTNVFDGDFSRPYTEADTPIAESEYGKFKMKCESMLQEMLGERAITIRIPMIWGKNSPRLNQIKESLKDEKVIEVFSNLVCNHHLDVLLAKQVRFMIENDVKGVFHLASIDRMMQSQFYEQILHQLGVEKSILEPRFFLDKEDVAYFQIESNREDIPRVLRYTNSDIISSLFQ
ncbi:sugar nucleotide-binding protein [Thermoactinomyces sp. DSM 45892]|uniref:sugar nucleotide-binding protein n=1 Tax=Thermoactinomyces sp. DSM 45892 TaxID=1882753 RepID=UPI0008995835|nr:sugar nucleotide-binding protein [Thermoactinomyces sp. DSM 45892]SDY04612.1 dTDP-4-dehydrorhamnose reductase [Thermoactinomyces sp. DSM 45892]